MEQSSASSGLWPNATPNVARFAMLATPALADYALGGGVVAAEEVRRSRLANRFFRSSALEWVQRVADAGIDAVYLKGFATAATVYPDPDIRGMADADLLVREADLPRLVALLCGEGFTFREVAGGRKPWGFISDASFLPFVSADGTVNFDLHIHPDDYPVHLTLDTEAVFAAALNVRLGGTSFHVPSADHLLLLALANAVRDKFAPNCVKSMLDASVLIQGHHAAIDWEGLTALADGAGWGRSFRAALIVLEGLGVAGIPADLVRPLGWPADGEAARVGRDLATMFERYPTQLEIARREVLLTAGPRTLAFKFGRRLRGLLRPRIGVPEGGR